MASISDFLFQGSAPPQVNSNGVQTNTVPEYLQQYNQSILAQANALSQLPYPTYGGQRLAAPNSTLQTGQQNAVNAAYSYQPMFANAGNILNSQVTGGATAATSPYLQQARSLSGTAAAQPYYGQAGGMSATGAAAGNLAAASGINAMGAAQPALNMALQSAPGQVGAYMSPYLNGVVDTIARKGTQNLQQNLLPALGDDFIRAGQLGSSRHMSAVGKAMSDTQQAVSDAQSAALNQGYQTALGAFQNDAGRAAQVGATQGNLALGQQQNLGALGQIQGNLTNAEQQNLTQLGTASGNLALGEQQNLGALGQIAGNMSSIDSQNAINLANANTSLGKATQSAGLTGAAAQEAVGNEQMAQEQKNLDLAYQDFQNQTNYPRTSLDWMATLTRGQPSMGGSVYTSTNAPLSGAQYGPSGLSSIVGGLSLMNALSKAKGGYVDADSAPAQRATGALGTIRRRPPPVRIPRGANPRLISAPAMQGYA